MIDLEKFFQEKEIPYQQWEIEHEGQTHIIDSETVIEAILSSKGKERKGFKLVALFLDLILLMRR